MIEIVASITSAVGAGLILHYIGRMKGPIRIRQVKSITDPHTEQTLELYQKIFPEDDGSNYSVEELMDVMNYVPDGVHHIEARNIILVAVHNSAVVGFLFAHWYPSRRKAIISYYAVDKEVREARVGAEASKGLARKLVTLLKKTGQCDILFYDVERLGPDVPIEARRRKIGRPGLFRARAKELHLDAREFQFEYHCPRVSMSDFAREQPFSLFCIGLNEPLERELPKDKILEYLRFVFFDCYGDIYESDDPRFTEYHSYLQKVLKEYEGSLPDVVRAR